MKFMLLVKASKQSEAGERPDPTFAANMNQFNQDIKQAGALIAAQGLEPSSHGARIQVVHKEVTVQDGPLRDATDLVCGYWVIETSSREDAIEWAKRAPFEAGEVEVRQLMEVPGSTDTIWDAHQPAPGNFIYVSFVMADEQTESGQFVPNPKVMSDIEALVVELSRDGLFLGAGGLLPSSSAARVRYFGRKRTVIDGPFAEAKELVGGFALLQASSKADMIAHAKRFCAVDAPGRYQQTCRCEVRPIHAG